MRLTDAREVLIFAFRRSTRARGPLKGCPAWSCTGLIIHGEFFTRFYFTILNQIVFFFFLLASQVGLRKAMCAYCIQYLSMTAEILSWLTHCSAQQQAQVINTEQQGEAGVKEVSREANTYTRWSSCSLCS